MKYYLMNFDCPIVEFETVPAYGITEIQNEKILGNPLPPGFHDVATWIERRNYAKHKEHMKKWLKVWGIDTTDGFLQITHALGLNDALWVKEAGSDLKWEKVNLYTNEFTDVACKTAFETRLFGLQLSSTTPEFTTDGTFPKCWIKDGDGIHILKQGLSGAANTGLEPYSEYIASDIARQIFNNIVSYDLIQYKGRLCTKCDLFTSENIGYVPFGRVLDSNRMQTIPGLLKYFEEYDKKNKTAYALSFRKMILVDSIVFNLDRHLNNFGFLLENASGEERGFAPIFDFNFAFLTTLTDEDLIDYRESFVKYDIGHKLGGNFTDVGQQILTPELKDCMPSHITIPAHDKYNMSSQRMSLLADIFEENYQLIYNYNVLRIVQPFHKTSH